MLFYMHTAAKYHLASQLGGFLLPILKKKVRHTFYVTLYQYQRAQRQANNMPNTAKLQLQFKPTRSSATADGPCSTQCQLKSCLLLNSCTGHITLTTPICNEFVILRLTLWYSPPAYKIWWLYLQPFHRYDWASKISNVKSPWPRPFQLGFAMINLPTNLKSLSPRVTKNRRRYKSRHKM